MPEAKGFSREEFSACPALATFCVLEGPSPSLMDCRDFSEPHMPQGIDCAVNHLLTLRLALTVNVVQPTQNWPVEGPHKA